METCRANEESTFPWKSKLLIRIIVDNEEEPEFDDEETDEDEKGEDQIRRALVGTPDSDAFTSATTRPISSSAEGLWGKQAEQVMVQDKP